MKFPFCLPENRKFDAVGFGTNAVDHLIRLPRFPEFGSKVEFAEHLVLPGGEIASTMVGLRRLGFRTAYAGRFGDDRGGEIGLSSLAAEHVDIRFTETITGAETQVAFILIDESTGERTIAWRRDARLAYSPTDVPLELAELGKLLHITPHDPAACTRLATKARDRGTIVSLDIDRTFDGVRDLLTHVDICLVSEDFPSYLFEISDPGKALQEIASRFGCKVTGITLGDRGSLILCDGVFFSSPAYSVPGGCVDTTGAGDAFRTGFLYGILTGSSVEASATYGNAVAALKCRGLGARRALPTSDELSAFLTRAEPLP